MYLLKAIEDVTGKVTVMWVVNSLEEAKEAAERIYELKPMDAGMMHFQVFLDSDGNLIDEFTLP